jgi:hypothetical protein
VSDPADTVGATFVDTGGVAHASPLPCSLCRALRRRHKTPPRLYAFVAGKSQLSRGFATRLARLADSVRWSL